MSTTCHLVHEVKTSVAAAEEVGQVDFVNVLEEPRHVVRPPAEDAKVVEDPVGEGSRVVRCLQRAAHQKW